MSTVATDLALGAKHSQGLGLINRWPDTEQKQKANKGKGREQKWKRAVSDNRNTNEKMAASHPFTCPGQAPFNLVKSAPKIKAVSPSELNYIANPTQKRKLLWSLMRQYGAAQHCVGAQSITAANCFIWGKKRTFAFSQLPRGACGQREICSYFF